MKISMEQRKNLYTYLFLIGFAIVGIVYGKTLLTGYANLRIWSIVNILMMLFGIPFIFFQSKAKLPNFWEPKISNVDRFGMPLLIGLIFGLLDVLVFKAMLHPQPYTEQPPFLQPFPYSLFLYLSGAFEVEVFYRLVPLTLFMLLGAYYRKGRYMDYFFWVGAILTALREPLEQMGENLPWVMVYALLTGFLMNLLQAIHFRKAGFLASLTLRLGHYLMWHILLGVYVESFEMM